MYHVSAQGVDERMINVQYYYYCYYYNVHPMENNNGCRSYRAKITDCFRWIQKRFRGLKHVQLQILRVVLRLVTPQESGDEVWTWHFFFKCCFTSTETLRTI